MSKSEKAPAGDKQSLLAELALGVEIEKKLQEIVSEGDKRKQELDQFSRQLEADRAEAERSLEATRDISSRTTARTAEKK